ncbi:MAG: hypothetical protein IKR85_02330 [Clostridia bacterium]|nr:hypothetical protein [Clostridia bacterium]
MKKLLCTLLALALCLLPGAHAQEGYAMDTNKTDALRTEIWNEYAARERADAQRVSEDENQEISLYGVTMKYGIKVFGEPDENGLYPLYIALHGGGSDDTGEINDSQWRYMSIYYAGDVKNGIYVNPRAVRDTWDCHSNPESYPLYDRLIENMILFRHADPNRVYLLGFSAGGDGVYQIAPRMADRFAAANMSAGHPNGVRLESLYDLPFQLQVGISDDAYSRNTVTAEYGVMLDGLETEYPGGYIHKTYIHIGRGHNFVDNDPKQHLVAEDIARFLEDGTYTGVRAQTGAVEFVSAYTRRALPERVIWNTGVRADMRRVNSFYYLTSDAREGIIDARIVPGENRIIINTQDLSGGFGVLLHDRLFDLDRSVIIVKDGQEYEITPEISVQIMRETLCERGDPEYIFECRADYCPETDSFSVNSPAHDGE